MEARPVATALGRDVAAHAALRYVATSIAEGGSLEGHLELLVREGRPILDACWLGVRCGPDGAGIGGRPAIHAEDGDMGSVGIGGERRSPRGSAVRPRTLVVPIATRDTDAGVLVARAARDPDAETWAHELARLAAIAIARAGELAELQAIARTDPLTGLRDRRAFDERLRAECRLAALGSCQIALALLDIDHFKALNDRHGHAAGDLALRAVATAIASCARAADLVARVGGEEIAWLMIGTDAEGAAQAGSRALTAVRALELPTGRLTVSGGVAAYREQWSASDLLDRADRALYAAKGLGRDRLELADRRPSGGGKLAVAISPTL